MTTSPPDPTNPDLLKGLRNYLISQGIVRDPEDGAHPSLPPMWIDPRFGTPAPGESEGLQAVEVGQNVVTSISTATGIPPRPYEGFLRNDGVEFVVRVARPPLGKSFENSVRAAINDKRGWMMDNVPVNESLLYRDIQPIGSDNQGWVYTFEYMFSLWGPFTPVGP